MVDDFSAATVSIAAGGANLRSWQLADAPVLARRANDRRIWLGLRDAFPHPYAEDDAGRFIEFAIRMRPQTHFAIAIDGAATGGIGYVLKEDVERVSAEVGYWLHPDFWGRGIATAALSALAQHAFASHPELRRLYAVPFSSNIASARVLEKAGFQREGTLRQSAIKDGRVLDQWMYSLVREEL